MSPKDQETREKLLQAAIALLAEETNPERITVRQITQKAGVGLGSLNYHFASKESLLSEAAMLIIEQEANRWFQPDKTELDPIQRLKNLYIQTAKLGLEYPELVRIPIGQAFLEGNLEVQRITLPIVREICKEQLPEEDILFLTYQVVSTLQASFVQIEAFSRFVGFSLDNEDNVELMVNKLVDNLFARFAKK